jgi:hypothetical protein
LIIDREEATDAAKASAFQIKAQGLLPGGVGRAVELWLRRLVAVTVSTLKALTSSAATTSFNLSFSHLAMGTGKHGKLYTLPMLV